MTRRLRTAAAAVAVALLAAAPAGAQAPPPPGAKSANVSALTTLPEPNAISANFRGNLMYLSTLRGLSIYDIARPESPRRLSHLPLPHFENEDVDTNGEILLISNDPSEGQGILYVIDVRDPARPERIAQLNTGLIDVVFNDFLPEQLRTGTGHTATCIQGCRYAYLAGTRKGIDIVDLTDPRNPRLAGNFEAKEATDWASHDVQVDSSGLAWVAGANGTAAYDVTDPLAPKLVYRTDETAKSKYGVEPTDGKALNDFIHHNSMRMNNSSLASPPAGADPNAESDVVLVTEEDYTRPGCEGAGQFETWRIGADGVLRALDSFAIEVDPNRTTLCSAHYFDERGGLVAQGWYEGGTRFLDVTDPTDIRQVGYWIPDKNVTWGAYYAPTDPNGEIVYALDNARGVDVVRIARDRPDTSTPPVSGAGTGGASPSPEGDRAPAQGSQRSPNVRVKISDRRRRVRAGQTVEYAVEVRNTGGGVASEVGVTVDLPRGLVRVRGGRRAGRGRQVQFTVARLGPQEGRRMRLVTRVSRRYRGTRLDVAAAVTAAGDVDPRNNFHVDRNRVSRRRSGSSSSRLAARTAAMPAVVAPRLGAAETRAYAVRFGRLCRVALGA